MFKIPSFDDIETAADEQRKQRKESSILSAKDSKYHRLIPPAPTEVAVFSSAPPPPPPPTAITAAVSAAKQSTTFKTRTIMVNPRQKGNPILEQILNCPYEYAKDLNADFVVGQGVAVLFLSIRYHRLHPDYVYERMKAQGMIDYRIRILLVQIDVEDHQQAVRELTKLCILQKFTIVLAWSPEEASRILETYKIYESKPADTIKERVETDFMSQMTDFLTSVRGINKTDVITLISNFGTLREIVGASEESLAQCPGLGPQKISRLKEAFETPFLFKK